LGTKEFKQALLRDHTVATEARAWESIGVREVRESQWDQLRCRLLEKISQKTRRDPRKSAPWKIQIAQQMKDHSDASNGWLAEKLGMGSAIYLSKHVGLARRKVKGKA